MARAPPLLAKPLIQNGTQAALDVWTGGDCCSSAAPIQCAVHNRSVRGKPSKLNVIISDCLENANQLTVD